MEYLPNKLTPLYSKIYYKEKNYLKVRTVVFKYITPPYSKGLSMLVYWYISIFYIFIFLYSHILNSYYVLFMWLSYPLFYSFTGSINPASYVLILTCLKSYLSICTILFIRSVIFTLYMRGLYLGLLLTYKVFTIPIAIDLKSRLFRALALL